MSIFSYKKNRTGYFLIMSG